jgi:16S rRNA (uracil1498-N3)-methyltransferase
VAEVHWFVAQGQDDWRDAEVWLPAEESHHAVNVLRVAAPDVITVTDGRGLVARCAVERVEGGRLVAEVLERHARRPPKPEIAVYQGAAKGAKVDSVVEKLAELGVVELCVYQSVRSVARWDAAKAARLQERWSSIARSAAKQSRNPFVLQAHGVVGWDELLRGVAAEPFSVALWEEASLPLRTALVGAVDRVALIVGPEGGLERGEAEALAEAGAQLVSLGPRILRTENASVVAASALLFHYGLIG